MKLVVEESESAELERHLPEDVGRATSRLAVVEASRAARMPRTRDAIHLASGLYIDGDELVAYDRRLLDAAEAQGLQVAAPGLR